MCRPSAISAREPNRLPPMISAAIMTPHNPMTAHVLRALRSCPVPRKTCLCWKGLSVKSWSVICPSLEIAVDDGDQLIGGVDVQRPGVFVRTDQVRADVLFHHLGQETIDGAPATGDKVHDLLTPFFLFERAHDCLGLAADAACPIQELLLLPNGVAHGVRDPRWKRSCWCSTSSGPLSLHSAVRRRASGTGSICSGLWSCRLPQPIPGVLPATC